jgi:hypothetical protein
VRKRRTTIVNTRWMSVDRLITPAYYQELFPLPRDRTALRESFERCGYRPEYPLTIRQSELVEDHFEIVCGVGRFDLACERGMRRVPVIVREMTAEEALRYAIEDNLFAAGSSVSLTLTQTIFLSRLLKGRGKSFPPRLVRELAGVSESTFWRAVKALDLAFGKATGDYRELEDLEPHRRFAAMLRRDLFPDFTRLWIGTLEVNSFHQAYAEINTGGRRGGSGRSKGRARGQESPSQQTHTVPRRRSAKGNQVPDPVNAPANVNHTPGSGTRPARGRKVLADDNLTLFER